MESKNPTKPKSSVTEKKSHHLNYKTNNVTHKSLKLRDKFRKIFDTDSDEELSNFEMFKKYIATPKKLTSNNKKRNLSIIKKKKMWILFLKLMLENEFHKLMYSLNKLSSK